MMVVVMDDSSVASCLLHFALMHAASSTFSLSSCCVELFIHFFILIACQGDQSIISLLFVQVESCLNSSTPFPRLQYTIKTLQIQASPCPLHLLWSWKIRIYMEGQCFPFSQRVARISTIRIVTIAQN